MQVIYACQQFYNTTRNSLHCRKPVWAKLKTTAYEGLNGRMYTPLPATAAQACLQSRSLGVAKLRLLPKKTGWLHVELRVSNCLPTSCVLFQGTHT